MEQSPSWQVSRFTASQEITRIVWNPKVHYRIHKCPPPVPILNQLDLVHTRTSLFLKIHLHITFPTTRGFSKWSISLQVSTPKPCTRLPSSHTSNISRPFHSSRFDHPNCIGWGVQVIKLLIMQFSSTPATSMLFGPRILLSPLFSCYSYLFCINISSWTLPVIHAIPLYNTFF
jgi:hypothetical protein